MDATIWDAHHDWYPRPIPLNVQIATGSRRRSRRHYQSHCSVALRSAAIRALVEDQAIFAASSIPDAKPHIRYCKQYGSRDRIFRSAASGDRQFWLDAVMRLALVTSVAGLLDELTQPLFGRDMEWYDWLADSAGGLCGAVLALLALRLISAGRAIAARAASGGDSSRPAPPP
jgi:hypothetical protein